MLKGVDADHVLIGPGGVVVVETKYRSSWADADLASMARQVSRNAQELVPKVYRGRGAVTSVVAMWGAGAPPTGPAVDVAVVPGSVLAEWVRVRTPIRTGPGLPDRSARAGLMTLGLTN